jgi:hypothetical protein
MILREVQIIPDRTEQIATGSKPCTYTQDIVRDFHFLHLSQPIPVRWGMPSCPGAGLQNANATRIYVIIARGPMLHYE